MLESVLLAKVCDEKPFIGNCRIQTNSFCTFFWFCFDESETGELIFIYSYRRSERLSAKEGSTNLHEVSNAGA